MAPHLFTRVTADGVASGLGVCVALSVLVGVLEHTRAHSCG